MSRPSVRVRPPALGPSRARRGLLPPRPHILCRAELDEERRPLALGRLDPDAPVEPANELPDDVQTEPRSADAARHVGVEAVELLEDTTLLGMRYAEPLIGHGE